MQNNTVYRPTASQDYLNMMLAIAAKAGKLSLKYLDNSKPTLKKDLSILTKADIEISKLCRQALAKTLKDPAHLLINEEDDGIAQYLNQKRLSKTSFLWAIDPIDGTRLYANRMPMYGISLGLIKDRKPWLGVVYFPALKELFYCDGKQAYFVQNAFSPRQKKVMIRPIQEKLSPKSLFFCNDTFFNKFAWEDKSFHIMINACAVINLCWPSIGRGVGCFLRAHLWDFAGSWPILRKAGLDFRSVKTGKVMTEVQADLFNLSPKPWELKEHYLISSRGNYFKIKSKIIDLSSVKK